MTLHRPEGIIKRRPSCCRTSSLLCSGPQSAVPRTAALASASPRDALGTHIAELVKDSLVRGLEGVSSRLQTRLKVSYFIQAVNLGELRERMNWSVGPGKKYMHGYRRDVLQSKWSLKELGMVKGFGLKFDIWPLVCSCLKCSDKNVLRSHGKGNLCLISIIYTVRFMGVRPTYLSLFV